MMILMWKLKRIVMKEINKKVAYCALVPNENNSITTYKTIIDKLFLSIYFTFYSLFSQYTILTIP